MRPNTLRNPIGMLIGAVLLTGYAMVIRLQRETELVRIEMKRQKRGW